MSKEKYQLNAYECIHCGHPVMNVGNRLLHCSDSYQKSVEATKLCDAEVSSKEINEFTDGFYKRMNSELKEKFGDMVYIWVWFPEIHCSCNNPEINETSKKVKIR